MNKFYMVIAGLLVATSASAAPYGAAGCGIGSIIIGDKPGIMQLFAATSNGFSGSQSFGITFGTSNCGAPAEGAPAAKAFIETNRAALAKDAARGSGETIVSLAALAGCANSQAVGVALQKNYTTLFPSATASTEKVSHAVLQSLKTDKTLACGKLG